MCAIACPVDINTGDLVRRLRAESQGPVPNAIADAAARAWGPTTSTAALALTAAHLAPSAVAGLVTAAGRIVVGDDIVPLYDGRLPRGGKRRRPVAAADAVAVYFPSCVNTMFGPERGAPGVRTAFERLCERAGITVRVPDGIDGMCCGTPWKSKGYLDGNSRMSRVVLAALFEESDSGRLPIVCDAASCTEGLDTMRDAAASLGYESLTFVDVVEFVHDRLLDKLPAVEPVESLVLHHTCSTAALGVNAKLTGLSRHVARRVIVPDDEGCCAFAGDRGMLHPELTASATAAEAAEVQSNPGTVYVSANRTCEIGMTRATGQPYLHVLEVLERVTRGPESPRGRIHR
jgi:D-lactate dehydrogenase